ncbi:hydroxyproline O-arabinosyltransferase 3-like isoform X1 [Ananas comosus]|uniref:Hydroxyproline O-arabinosyltransferase 3-like isoform X1 n=1 Tax=Ananas comosus TaxID=4615 RepID=A0A6P5F1D5_ANACO|nr:hydroxyproline O-arabinosyltransferase 3-like isoform X1 [Ananas comosus]XP_020087309.1 hydroxyproline O-arabinosyltransferase 3-like isoform X1 [Ananas comosus]
MNARKEIGRASQFLAAAAGLGLFFAAFNFAALFVPPRREGSSVADDDGRINWFTGDRELAAAAGKRPFHVAMTAMADPYSRWQCRIMYYWYKRAKAAGAGAEEMGGFTRVLHSGEADDLMGEIPTFVVNPLPPGADRGYVVLNRPWAFVQWLERAEIQEEYILMAEPDHIFVKPLPNLVREDRPVAYPFFYIRPAKQEKILRKYYPEEKGPVTNIDPIGNSPVIIKKSALTKIAPTWMNMSLEMKMDNKTDKAFGWVLEMYAYAVASALHGVHHILYKDFMIQPPWDLSVGETFIIHYTYGCDYSLKGELTYGKIGEWRFDKRSYLKGPLPRNLSLPPPGVPESVVTLVKMVNEATANIPGWDDDDDDNSELRSKFEELNELHTLKLIQETEKNYI